MKTSRVVVIKPLQALEAFIDFIQEHDYRRVTTDRQIYSLKCRIINAVAPVKHASHKASVRNNTDDPTAIVVADRPLVIVASITDFR